MKNSRAYFPRLRYGIGFGVRFNTNKIDKGFGLRFTSPRNKFRGYPKQNLLKQVVHRVRFNGRLIV